MRGIIRAIDRFCYKNPRFGIPNLMIFIIIGNAAVFLASMLFDGFLAFLVFDAAAILRGQVWRLITFVLVPQVNNLLFLAVSLYFYYFIGTTLNNNWGVGKFTIYYLSGMLFMILYGFIIYFTMRLRVQLTSYYLNLGMFFVFATFFPDMRVLFMFFIPVKIKWLAVLNLVYFVIEIVLNPFPINLMPVVCLLHYFVFCGAWLIDLFHPTTIRQKKQRINFKIESERIRREQDKKQYTRKCEVCGKTDTDYPNMEFRFCSSCEGFHCYCQDHINSHIHRR